MESSPKVPQQGNLTRRRFIGATLGIGAFLTGCTSESPPSQSQREIEDCRSTPISLEHSPLPAEGLNLADEKWHMPGLTESSGQLHLTPSPITIAGKDGKDRALLPFWPDRRFDASTLRISGSLRLASSQTKASLLFAAELPITHDDFQFPGKGLRVSVDQQACTLEIWDGEHHDPTIESFFLDKKGLQKEIKIIKKDGKLRIIVDGQPIKECTGFTQTQAWIGLETINGDSIVDELCVSSPDKNATVADMTSLQADSCNKGLRAIAAKAGSPCAIGTAVALTPLLQIPTYAALLAGNFTAITTENALKPQFVQPQEGQYTFHEAERLVAFADRHNMQVHGHALLPNRSMPEWMRDLPVETAADKARVQQVMVEHITTIMKHFPTIESFDVVNEPLDGTGWHNTIWHHAMGDQFINIAFAAAHKANPHALLFINDCALDKADDHDEKRFTILLEKLRTIRQEIPRALVGIGFEGHVYQTPRDSMSPDDLRRRMKLLMNHGMVARVSEMDVTPQDAALQAQQFGDIAKVCLESPACVSFTMWGIGGKYVSTAGIDGKGELTWESHLPWDDNLRQRPHTYAALQEALNHW